jgi:DNA uptake protein ComE-like DNA-binding protein
MKKVMTAVVAISALLLGACASSGDNAPSGTTQSEQSPQQIDSNTNVSTDPEQSAASEADEASSPGLQDEADVNSFGVAPSNQNTATSASTLEDLIDSLPVAVETPNGYDRDLFKHWIDADGDGCDTREEVLIAESLKVVTVGSGCSISGGEWLSAFDLVVTTNPSSFDVDHFVPLKEAWDSGASKWDSATRQAFANDLGYEMSLIAVSASSNRSKSDRDPADWLPTNADYECEYAVAWAQVKSRWSLSIDVKEKRALLGLAGKCGNDKLDFNPKAPVAQGTAPAASATPSPTLSPSKTASPSATPTPTGTQVASTCQPGQVDINIASVEELMRIKHISTARAPDVVSSRPYTSLDQLTRVKGIAAGRLADIKAEGIACVG